MARHSIVWVRVLLLVLATLARGVSAGRGFQPNGTVASNSSRTLLKFLRPKRNQLQLQLVDARNGNVIGDIVNGTTISVRHLESTGIGRWDFAVRVIPGWRRTRAVVFQSRSQVLRTNDYPYPCLATETSCDVSIASTIITKGWKRYPFTCLRLEASDTHRLLIQSSPYIGRGRQNQQLDVIFSIGPLAYVCNASKRSCGRSRSFDGTCDVKRDCEYGNPCTDCFDCDPCQQYNLQSCEACTTAPEGCVWCGAEARCLTAGTLTSPNMACQASNFTSHCTPTTPSVFSDPLLDSMTWLYDMINVKDVWRAGITGKGIGIRINDVGVDSDHPEIESKFDVASSCPLFKPYALKADYNQGTASASIAAASGNSSCAVGIAPDARLSSCRVLPSPIFDDSSADDYFLENDVYPVDLATDESTADSSYLHKYMETMHISSNSFSGKSCVPKTRSGQSRSGPDCLFKSNDFFSPCSTKGCWSSRWSPNCDRNVIRYCQANYLFNKRDPMCSNGAYEECRYIGQSLAEQQAFTEGILNGRNGKGIIYVFAAGNDFGAGNDVNFEGTLTSRYVISVGAVGKDKVHASYSTPGAALFVSAPGGDSGPYLSPINVVALAGGGCVEGGYGSQFASPVVSGVIALILQVNDNLTWRDVQGIIASTSQQVFPKDPSWTTNAAGLHHSYLYGFGIIDAKAAVEAAQTWVNYNAEQQILAESGPINATVANFLPPKWTASTVAIKTPSNFTVESVVVYIDLKNSSGFLEIALVSPQGTISTLALVDKYESRLLGDESVRLLTFRKWGESANGNWTLRWLDNSRFQCDDLPGWSVNVTVPPNNTQFKEGTRQLDCEYFRYTRTCSYPYPHDFAFNLYFAGIFTGINDPKLTDSKGVSLTQACCACGGGQSVPTVFDVLKSWRIAVYGHSV